MTAPEVLADDRFDLETSEHTSALVGDAAAAAAAAAAGDGVGATNRTTTTSTATEPEPAGAVMEAWPSDGGEDAAAGSLAAVEAAATAWFDRKVFSNSDFNASRYVDDMSPYVSSPRAHASRA